MSDTWQAGQKKNLVKIIYFNTRIVEYIIIQLCRALKEFKILYRCALYMVVDCNL